MLALSEIFRHKILINNSLSRNLMEGKKTDLLKKIGAKAQISHKIFQSRHCRAAETRARFSRACMTASYPCEIAKKFT